MTRFQVAWKVIEVYNGASEEHPHGLRHTIASATVVKEGYESKGEVERLLLEALMVAYPKQRMGGTYEVDRIYEYAVTRIADST